MKCALFAQFITPLVKPLDRVLTFRWRVRLMLFSNGSQEIWGSTVTIMHQIISISMPIIPSFYCTFHSIFHQRIFLENLIHSCCHFANLSFIVIMVNMTNIVMLMMIIMCTVNDEYVKLFVWQPAGGSGGPEGTRRNEHGWPLVIIIMMIMITMTKMIILTS